MLIVSATPEHLAACARALAQGELVGMPTETVYGLAADALNTAAVNRIFSTKGRPNDHPVIVHVASAAALDAWGQDISLQARALAQRFWPGPLTLIVQKSDRTPAAVTGGQNTVGLRCPAHPVAQQLLAAFCAITGDAHSGLAAPSANRFGRVSPTTAQHVAQEFTQLTVLDGGACDVGIESTIVDCSRGAPVVLRPGAITPAMLADCLGSEPALHQPATDHDAPRASGLLESHYAPNAPVMLFTTGQFYTTLQRFLQKSKWHALKSQSNQPFSSIMPQNDYPAGVLEASAPKGLSNLRLAALTFENSADVRTTIAADSQINLTIVRNHVMPLDATLYAQQLYANLRALDASGVDMIAVEHVPNHPQWLAVRDRLTRAAA